MSDTIRIRVNKKIPPHAPGDEVAVEVDSEGTPFEQLWRRRLRDAERDDCCEVIPAEKPKSKPRRRAVPAPASEE